MGLLLLSLLIGCWEPASAQQLATVAHNDYRQDDQLVSLQKALQKLEAKFQVSLNYDYRTIRNRFVPANQLDELDLDVEKSLADILGPLDLQYKKIDEQYYIVFEKKRDKELFKVEGAKLVEPMLRQRKPPSHLHQFEQKLEKTLSGTVTDASDNSSLPGVNIVVKNTTNGTVTDIDGKYSLNVPDDAETLVFSSVGYISEEATIGNRTVINVQMAPDIQSLKEVVVVGYGTQRKKDVTGAIASVPAEEIADLPIASIDQALQGRAAGVQVIQSGGVPGGPVSVKIRGYGSVGTEEPLYVIDGVPVQGGNQNALTGESPINNLNPNDIESIEILKDASAAAIYGARASAGVVIITTKRGKSGKASVNYNGYYGVSEVYQRYDLMNKEQYLQFVSDYDAIISEENPNYSSPGVIDANPDALADTDWQDQLLQTGITQKHDVTVSGGGENSNFLLSTEYYSQEGTIKTSKFDRYSLRLNSDFSLSDKIRIGESVSLSRTARDNITGGSRGIIELAVRIPPVVPVYDPDNIGGYAQPTNQFNGPQGAVENPLATLFIPQGEVERYRIVGNVYAEVDLLEGLTYKANLGLEFGYSDSRAFNPVFDAASGTRPSNLSQTRSETLNPLIENTLTYRKTFNKHSFSLLAGVTRQSFNASNVTASGNNLPETNDANVLSNVLNPTVGGEINESSLQSFLGRMTYDFDNKYLLTASVRQDGSSKLAPGNRYQTFPSFSVGWRLSNEPFLRNATFISELKLRGGYGELGNVTPLGDYPYVDPLQLGFGVVLGEEVVPGASQTRLSNRNIHWESVKQTNFGIDVGLFDDALLLTADYYTKQTDGMIYGSPVPPSVGLGSPAQNIGIMENRGFELALTYRKSVGDFNFDASGNFSTVYNNVVRLSLADGAVITSGETYDEWGDLSISRTEAGYPVGQFYGYLTDGLFQEGDDFSTQPDAQPGDIRYKDIAGPQDENGNFTAPDGVIDGNDRTFIGNPLPDLTYGFTFRADYKGIDLSLFLQGMHGNDVFNAMKFWTEALKNFSNQSVQVLDRWTPENTTATIPRINPGETNRRGSDRYVEDGSFMRVKNLTLGYTFNKSWLDRLGVFSQVRIYATAQNLLTLTRYSGLDPEIGSQRGTALEYGVDEGNITPIPRTFIFGLQAGL